MCGCQNTVCQCPKANPDNMYVISEQGDLGLGTRQLTDEEQKLMNEQKAHYQQK